MSEVTLRPVAALAGLAVAVAIAVWWLGSVRVAIDRGADAGRSSAEALQLAWVVRALFVPMLSVRAGVLHGWRAGAAAALAIVAPSSPLVVLAWSASSAPLARVALAEALLLVAALVLPLVGSGLRRALPQAAVADAVATALGVVIAATAAFGHDRWTWAAGL